MHPQTKKFVDKVLYELKFYNDTQNILKLPVLEHFYKLAEEEINDKNIH